MATPNYITNFVLILKKKTSLQGSQSCDEIATRYTFRAHCGFLYMGLTLDLLGRGGRKGADRKEDSIKVGKGRTLPPPVHVSETGCKPKMPQHIHIIRVQRRCAIGWERTWCLWRVRLLFVQTAWAVFARQLEQLKVMEEMRRQDNICLTFTHVLELLAAIVELQRLSDFRWGPTNLLSLLTCVTCCLVLRGPPDLNGEPLDGGHPGRLVLGYLVPVSFKQDDFLHIIVHFSVLCIGYFETICTTCMGLFHFTGYIVPTWSCPNREKMFSDLEAAVFGPQIQGSGGRSCCPDQCCGAGASRSRYFLVGAGAGVKM